MRKCNAVLLNATDASENPAGTHTKRVGPEPGKRRDAMLSRIKSEECLRITRMNANFRKKRQFCAENQSLFSSRGIERFPFAFIRVIRGPYYTPMGKRYLADVLETTGAYINK